MIEDARIEGRHSRVEWAEEVENCGAEDTSTETRVLSSGTNEGKWRLCGMGKARRRREGSEGNRYTFGLLEEDGVRGC